MFQKVDQQNIGPVFFLRFVSILFLMFEEGVKETIGQVFQGLLVYFF